VCDAPCVCDALDVYVLRSNGICMCGAPMEYVCVTLRVCETRIAMCDAQEYVCVTLCARICICDVPIKGVFVYMCIRLYLRVYLYTHIYNHTYMYVCVYVYTCCLCCGEPKERCDDKVECL